jgi:hypothetical protein
VASPQAWQLEWTNQAELFSVLFEITGERPRLLDLLTEQPGS